MGGKSVPAVGLAGEIGRWENILSRLPSLNTWPKSKPWDHGKLKYWNTGKLILKWLYQTRERCADNVIQIHLHPTIVCVMWRHGERRVCAVTRMKHVYTHDDHLYVCDVTVSVECVLSLESSIFTPMMIVCMWRHAERRMCAVTGIKHIYTHDDHVYVTESVCCHWNQAYLRP